MVMGSGIVMGSWVGYRDDDAPDGAVMLHATRLRCCAATVLSVKYILLVTFNPAKPA